MARRRREGERERGSERDEQVFFRFPILLRISQFSLLSLEALSDQKKQSNFLTVIYKFLYLSTRGLTQGASSRFAGSRAFSS